MDNVERFDSGIDAVRKVKELMGKVEHEFDKIYLAYSDYYEQWYISDDNYDMCRAFHQRWCDSGCDSSPENESENWHVWEYVMAVKKEKYPSTYRKSKPSLIRSKIPMIRVKKTVGCEFSVDFTI